MPSAMRAALPEGIMPFIPEPALGHGGDLSALTA